jgi:hypothetical protein
MKPEGSLLCSQEPAAGPYPELHESSPNTLFYFSNIHFNIVLPSTSLPIFIPGLFNNDLSSSYYIASSDRNARVKNWKRCGRKLSWPISGTVPAFSCSPWAKPEIRTEYLSNISHKRLPFDPSPSVLPQRKHSVCQLQSPTGNADYRAGTKSHLEAVTEKILAPADNRNHIPLRKVQYVI